MINELSFDDIEKAKINKKPIEGLIENINKDFNMIVSLGKDIEGVIPYSEIYEPNNFVLNKRVGTNIKFYVKDITHRPGKHPLIILSPKDYAIDLEQHLYSQFIRGNEVIVCGLVTNINKYGNSAFIDIGGGLTGRLYIADVCKVRLKRIEEMIKINTIINAVIKEFDSQKRIQLTTKKMFGTFQENIEKLKLMEHTTCDGIVRGNDPNGNGMFVEILPNLIGLADFPSKINVSYGDKVKVFVKKIESDIEGLSLEILNKSATKVEYKEMHIRVPNIIGLCYPQAINVLKDKGCSIIKRDEEYSELGIEKVIRTEPEKDSIIGEYDTVRIIVSKGAARKVAIPKVTGIDIDNAETMLNEMGIKYEIKREFNSEYDENTVIQVIPNEGTCIKENDDVVILHVSKGKLNKPEYERSPYAMRKNETKVKEESKFYKDAHTLNKMLETNKINEIDVDVLEIISKHKFIVSNQITNILKTRYDYNVSQNKVQNRLEKLMNIGLIARYHFESDEGSGIFRAYCLRLGGNIFLYNLRQILYRRAYKHEDVPPYRVKSYLAANQISISYLLNPCMGEIESYEFDKKLCYRVISRDFNIRSHLNIVFKQNNLKINCNIEIVRRTEEWDFLRWVEKLTRYQAYYETLMREEGTIYNLIILCEDEKHMFEIYENIEKAGIYFKAVELLYSCDLRHNPNKLSKLPEALVRLSYFDTISEHNLI